MYLSVDYVENIGNVVYDSLRITKNNNLTSNTVVLDVLDNYTRTA